MSTYMRNTDNFSDGIIAVGGFIVGLVVATVVVSTYYEQQIKQHNAGKYVQAEPGSKETVFKWNDELEKEKEKSK